MSKTIMTLLTAGLILVVSVMNVTARGGGGYKGRSGSYRGFYDTSSVSQETLDKYNKETLGLRQKLIDKNAELRKEYIKTEPNLDTVAKLQKDIIDLNTEIKKIANKYGLESKRHGRGKGGRKGGRGRR